MFLQCVFVTRSSNDLHWLEAIRARFKTPGWRIELSRQFLSCCQPYISPVLYVMVRVLVHLKARGSKLSSSKQTLNSDRFVGITLCPARGSHLGSGLYQQLVKSLSEDFISECMGTILNRIPCLPRSPRCSVLSIPSTQS